MTARFATRTTRPAARWVAHFTLQTALVITVNDSNGRTALYLGSLSSSLVALALVAQQPQLGRTVLVFALTVLPAILLLGLVTAPWP